MTPPAARLELDELVSGARQIGVELTESDATALLNFLDRFYSWNRYGGFTRIARRDAERLHLLDSLAVIGDLQGASSIADLGTGGGMPGIPLAITLRESELTLVESRRRRCTFLREIVRDYDLAGRVRVFEGDASSLTLGEGLFDAVVARAFLPPRELLQLGSRLIRPTGRVIVMGSDETWLREPSTGQLLKEIGLELRSDRTLVLPGGSETRRISRFERR